MVPMLDLFHITQIKAHNDNNIDEGLRQVKSRSKVMRAESYKVAKIRRTLLGSRSHEEGRLKLFLRGAHLLSVGVLHMLLAVIVI